MRLSVPLLSLFLLSSPLFLHNASAFPLSPAPPATQDLIGSGHYDEALAQPRRDHELFPYNDALRLNLAAIYAQVGQREMKLNRYREGATYLQEARELAPEDTSYRLLRGIALYFAKDADAARAELEPVSGSAAALAYLGRISYDAGDLTAALESWRKAAELEPKNEAVREMIEKATRELSVESGMEKGYSSMFDVTFDAELPPGFAGEVMDALESAYAAVGSDLEIFPRSRVSVILYTKKDYRSVTAGPDWSGGLYDGKIRLPIGGIDHLTPQLAAVLFHEYTHVLVQELTRGNVPTWFNEGLAEIEGRRQYDARVSDIPAAARGGHLPTLAVLSGPFTSLKGKDAALAYEVSHSVARFMVERYGWYAVRQILKNLGEKATMESAVAKGLENWAVDLPGVMREWRNALPAGEAQEESRTAAAP